MEKKKAPDKIQTVLTVNGRPFTNRFVGAGESKLSGPITAIKKVVEHRLTNLEGHKQMTWWNASTVVSATCWRIRYTFWSRRLTDTASWENTIYRRKRRHHQPPITVMKKWQDKWHKLFTKHAVNHIGSDN